MPRRDNAPVAPADLYRLYLLPTWQRQGIGSRLLVELEAWLRSQGYLLYGAYVHERNEPAKEFYACQGFVHKPECDIQDEWYLVKQLEYAGG
jgi:GNAT superfamily N-acetyltransferase